MSGYLWGLATLPLGVAALFACWFVAKGGYLLLGLLGKVGIVALGSTRPEARYTFAAVVASAKRTLVINKGTTGVVFFTGRARPDERGHLARLQAALHEEDSIGGHAPINPDFFAGDLS